MGKELTSFRGAGGLVGGSSPRQPTTLADTLVSTDRVEVILGLCEGPIKGLSNGNQSFFIGTTQYQNADGSYNFDLFDIQNYPGETPGEIITPVLGGNEQWRGINQRLVYNTPFVFTTQSNQLDQVIVRLDVQELYQTGINAQLVGLPGATDILSTFLPMTFQITVEYYAGSSGTYLNPFGGPLSITGKTQSDEYHEIRMLVVGAGPYTVRVTLNTPDQPSAHCVMVLEGYYEVTGGLFGLTRSVDVSTLLYQGQPVTRTTGFPPQRKDGTYGINYINVRILVNALYASDSSGDELTADVQFTIAYKASDSETWLYPFNGACDINGRTTTGNYISEHSWTVDPIDGTYDIQVTRTTGEDVYTTRSIQWDSWQEIVGGPAQFDGTAITYILGEATGQFSSVPDFSGIYDLKLVSLPFNYDPYGRTYTGIWDGTFKIDWTSNPAWCVYDLAMNSTYGARATLKNFSIDRYDAYAAGQWCDTLVPDGQGGYQPRYTYNGMIATQRSIRDQLRYMCGVFNGTFLDDLNGNVRIVFDNDDPAVALFTAENISVEGFTYSYTDLKTRFNYITVKYNDPNITYAVNSTICYDPDHISVYGRISLEFEAIGCTNAHEAYRRAAYKLLTATTEKEIVSFKTNRFGLMLRPFNFILVADPDMGNAISGRLLSISEDRTVVYLRDTVYLEQAIQYLFQCNYPNPDYPATSTDPTALVSIPFYAPVNGGTKAFVLSAPLPPSVDPRANFSLGAAGSLAGLPKCYRITSIEEAEGDPDMITIQAIEVNRNKIFLSDNAIPRQGLNYLNLPSDVTPPTGFEVTTTTVTVNNDNLANVTATAVASTDPRVTSYELQYRRSGEVEWISIAKPVRPRADVYNIPDGVYDFRLTAWVGTSLQSAWVYLYGQAAGLNVPPPDVTGLLITLVGTHFSLSWLPNPAANLSYYWVRFSPLTDGTATWEGATDVVAQVLATSTQVSAGTGTYFVKAVNTLGVASVNAAYVVGTASSAGLLTVETLDASPAWAGTITNGTVTTGLLEQTSLTTNNMSYEFLSSDYNAVFACTLTLGLIVAAQIPGNTISQWPTLASVSSLDGVPSGSYNTSVFIKIWDGTTWSAYQPFAAGIYTGRQFGIKVTITTTIDTIQTVLYRCTYKCQMTSRIVSGSLLLTEATPVTVTFTTPFKITPVVTPTNRNASQGDYYILSDVNDVSFTIQWYDVTGTAVSRLMDWIAIGFGGT